MNAFFKELKEHSVYRIAASYAVSAWTIFKISVSVGPALGVPPWAIKALLGVLLAGFTAALWIGWLKDRHVPAPGDPARRGFRQRDFLFAVIAVLPALLVLAGYAFVREPLAPVRPVAPAASGIPAIPEKSIAVLPFQSFSADPANAYFADGMQDEILTDLAKVADLKVISRTSVQAYRTGAHKSREIGEELGVAHLLEGSVQRDTGKVRVTAQLIDARSDSHLWAEHYDRELQDIFSLQTEVAERIVTSLKATLSPGEQASLKTPPTESLPAYNLYLQANELVQGFADGPDWREPLLKAVSLLDAATALDPNFALAYCLAAQAHDNLYWFDLDHTPARLKLAQDAVSAALRLQPTLSEAHLAQASLYYHGARDFGRARQELAVAKAALPNSAQAFTLSSWLERRQGQWPEAVRDQEEAASRDPKNFATLSDLTVLYDVLRRYPDEYRVAAKAIQALPQSTAYFQLVQAQLLLAAGQMPAASKLLQEIPPEHDPSGAATFTRVLLALYQRNLGDAAEALQASKLDGFVDTNGTLVSRPWLAGLIARAGGQAQQANAAFLSARTTAQASIDARPDDASAWALLGLVDAALGRPQDARREGARAVELRPTAADAEEGPVMETAVARIEAWTGESEPAIDRLARLAKVPGGPTYGELHFDPAWDMLRGNARFQQVLAAMPAPGPIQ